MMRKEVGKNFQILETLAMLDFDENYNGKEFVMTRFHFAADHHMYPLMSLMRSLKTI